MYEIKTDLHRNTNDDERRLNNEQGSAIVGLQALGLQDGNADCHEADTNTSDDTRHGPTMVLLRSARRRGAQGSSLTHICA